MSETSATPYSTIVLRRDIIVQQTGMGPLDIEGWRAELPGLGDGWQSRVKRIHEAVRAAREYAGDSKTRSLTIKVREGTRLEQMDVVDLILANEGPFGLDLSATILHGVDLSSDAVDRIQRDQSYDSSTGTPIGEWYSADTRGINFRGAKLARANLSEAHLWRVDFRAAVLTEAKFQGADVGHAHFDNADLVKADFTGAELSHAILTDANLDGLILRGANCQALNLVEVGSLRRAHFAFCKLGGTLITRECIGDQVGEEQDGNWKLATESYLALKNNFNSIGRYEDAAWAYVKEQQMEKMAYRSEWCPHGWRLWKGWGSLWCWLRNWSYELLTGYGERPILPLVWAAGLAAVVFPLLYWAIGALPGHGRAFSSSSPSDIDWAGWGDSIIFSLTSFGTLSFSRLQPEGALPNLIAALEAFTGVLLFALFIFTLGNRMSRS